MHQDFLGPCSEVSGFFKPIFIFDKDLVQPNVRVLNCSERKLPLDLFSDETLLTLAHEEALNLVTFVLVAGPHTNVVAESGVTDPSLPT